MARKYNDEEAFAHWIAQGDNRSMYATAQEFGVSRRAIGKCARRGNWMKRLGDIERDAREKLDRRSAETLADTRQRHLKMLRVVAAKGIQALQKYDLNDAMQAIRAIEMAIKLERMILGEPSETGAVTIESATRREMELLLVQEESDGGAE